MTSSVHRKKKIQPTAHLCLLSSVEWQPVGWTMFCVECVSAGGLKTSSEDLSRYTAVALAQS